MVGGAEAQIVDINSSIRPDKIIRLPMIINAFLIASSPANNTTMNCNDLKIPKAKQSGTTNIVTEE